MSKEDKPIHETIEEMRLQMEHDPVIDSCRGLLEELNNRKFIIQEDQFVRDLLPLLAGEETDVDLNFWRLNIGSWFSPVYVYKGDQELFRVPPIFNRNAVIAKKAEDAYDSIDNDMATYERKAHVSQGQANEFLFNAMRRRFSNEVDYIEEGKALNEILHRYNKPLLKLSEEAEATGLIKPEGKLNVAAATTTDSQVSTGPRHAEYQPDAFDDGGLD